MGRSNGAGTAGPFPHEIGDARPWGGGSGHSGFGGGLGGGFGGGSMGNGSPYGFGSGGMGGNSMLRGRGGK
jgi:hypothetical protein